MATVFISYRRKDSQGFAGRLTDDLIEAFGADRVFRDDEIEPGVDYTAALDNALRSAGVVIVVIGQHWLAERDDQGQRRLDAADDWVRREIHAALTSGTWLLPVLVGGACMPLAKDLPVELAHLTRQQAFVLNDQTWRRDSQALIELLASRLPAMRQPSHTSTRPVPSPLPRHDPFDRVLDRIAEGVAAQGSRQRLESSRYARVYGALGRRVKQLIFTALIVLFVYFVVTRYADPRLLAVLREFAQFLQGLARPILSALI